MGLSSIQSPFVEVSRNADGHQKPSNLRLRRVAEDLAAYDVLVNFVLNDVSNMDLEAGLRATLIHAFPDFVRNAFLTLEADGGVVWVVPKGDAIRNSMDDISGRIAIYLENAGIRLSEVRLTVDENLPSRTAILNELRIAAPATQEVLAERLASKGFSSPPLDYLSRHLDALRKTSFVVRRKDGNYCLAANALKVLGTVKKRSSPDITRLLDLARRGNL